MGETNRTEILEIVRSISNLERLSRIKEMVETAVKRGNTTTEIVEKGIRRGLEDVGKRYESGEYFLSELLYAGEIINGLFDVLKLYLKQDEMKPKGIILIGTVRGDMHDIGKNIFGMLAQFSGFKVYDLGVDVEPKRFIEEVRKTSPGILGMSTLLTSTLPQLKVVIDELKAAGIRNRVKIILGGNAVTKQFAEEVGADAAALDAVEGVNICKRWVAAQ